MEVWKEPITYITGAVAGAATFVFNLTLGTRKSVADHKLHAAETFATKADLIRSVDNVTNICIRLEDKFDKHIAKNGK